MRDAAARLGKAPHTLTRTSLRRYGLSPTALRREERVSRALRMLATSDAPLVDIATACGFSDQSHLSREIKAVTDHTPSTLRRMLRG